jgi:hypothetical protein
VLFLFLFPHFSLTCYGAILEQAEAQLAFSPPSKQDGGQPGGSLLPSLGKDEDMATAASLGSSSLSEKVSSNVSMTPKPVENNDPFSETIMVTESAEEW